MEADPVATPSLSPADETRVGFVGLGDMAGRIALRIAAAGLPLTVHDTRPDAVAELVDAGAVGAQDLADLATRSDVVAL
jgi:3-hydroxyisobutyrate dehydrogenase-like beta-hydroxyacid dehydrogenase